MQHLMTFFGGSITWDGLRREVRKRLDGLGADPPEGYFALPHARLLIARSAGCATWADFVATHEAHGSSS